MFTADERARFARDGFVVRRALADEALVGAANAEVDRLRAADPPPDTVGPHFWFRAPAEAPAVVRLLTASDGMRLAEELTAPARLVHAYGHVQVATTRPPWVHVPGGPHLDGYHDPARPHPFTVLVGVALTEQEGSRRGNLWVWPGSHLAHADLFRTRGPDALIETGGHSTLLEPPLELGDPVPVRLAPGDAVFAHYLLGHNSGGDDGPTPRRTAYFRLGTAHAADDTWHLRLTDAFHDFPTLAAHGRGDSDDGRPGRSGIGNVRP